MRSDAAAPSGEGAKGGTTTGPSSGPEGRVTTLPPEGRKVRPRASSGEVIGRLCGAGRRENRPAVGRRPEAPRRLGYD